MTRFVKALLFYILLFGCADDPPGEFDADAGSEADGGSDSGIDGFLDAPLFSKQRVPVFELFLSAEAIGALDVDPFEYQPGDFLYRPGDGLAEDIAIQNVGIRLKGRASFQGLSEKPAFKIKFNEYAPGQRLLGLRRLTLNNMVQDPSMVCERLGYMLFRRLGGPAPRCNSARVYLNGEYLGLYANVETLDSTFVKRRYGSPSGNLYDTVNYQYFVDLEPGSEPLFELETNIQAADTSDLTRLISGVNGPIDRFVADAQSVLSLDEFLTTGAMQAVIADWDGYFGARNNYKIYNELGIDRFVLFPWGIDQIFGNLYYNIDGSNSDRENGLVFQRCKEVSICYDKYLSEVRRALTLWESLPLLDELDDIVEQIEPYADADPRCPYSSQERHAHIADVRRFLQERAEIVQQQFK